MDSRIGSGRSPQNAQLTSMTSSAGRLPNPARAPKPPAANTALSRSVRNLFQIGSLMTWLLLRSGDRPVAAEHRVPHFPQFRIERALDQLVGGGPQVLQPGRAAGAGGDADDPRHRREMGEAPAPERILQID